MLDWIHRIVRALVGSPREFTNVEWMRDGRTFRFVLPGDDVWISVKDDLLIREYEWIGLDLPATTGLVVDAGAHVGTFTAMASPYAAHIVALEPNPATASVLRQNLLDNGLSTSVTVLPSALAAHDGESEMDVSGMFSAATLKATQMTTQTSGQTSAPADAISVKTTTLEKLIDEFGDIDVLKMDIEGSEFDVFRAVTDAALGRVNRIVGELHLHYGDERVVVDRLRSAGFVVDVRKGPYFEPRSALRSLRTHAGSVKGHIRLKLAVVVLYSLGSVLDRVIPGFRERSAWIPLRLFYAERPADDHAAPGLVGQPSQVE